MRMMMLLTVMALMLGVGATVRADAEAKSEEIKAEQVPAKVMQAVKKDYPNHTIEKIEKETYKNGTVHYEFDLKDKDGKKIEVEYDSEGKKLEDH